MPSWFSNSFKRHDQQQQEQQPPPPPPSIKARKLKEQAWQDAVTPAKQQNLSIMYQQPSSYRNQTPSHRPSTSTSSSTSPNLRTQQPAPTPSIPQPGPQAEEIEVLTQSLALRLEELATANHDGLLDDDEYRTLRKGLFDQINAANQQPILAEPQNHLNFSSPLGSESIRSPDALSQHQIPSQCHSPNPKSIHTQDQRSHRKASTLRHGTMSCSEAGLDSGSEHNQRTTSTAGSVYSAMHSDSGHPSLFHTPSSFQDAARPEIMASIGQASSSGMRLTSTAPGNLSSPIIRRVNHSFDSTSIPRRKPSHHLPTSIGPNDHHHHQPQQHAPKQQTSGSQDYGQIEWSSTEIKQEIHELELECAKLLETFDEMEKNLVAKYRTIPRAGPGGPVTKLEELNGLLSQQQQQHSPPLTTGMGEPMELDQVRPQLTRRASHLRPTSFLAPLLNPRAFKPKSRSIYREMRASSHHSTALRHQQPDPSMSQQPLVSSSHRASPSIDNNHHHNISGRGLLFQQDQPHLLRSDPNQESELQVELDFILQSRLKVANKYQDRLVYLRAKLKGALIRELSS
ncbi:hypothetical protein VP01_1854g4 [Puccinia sorghi]|uniref:Uncharacterized protein n=1 Tax=Puccinia sorghi TaxID=27349 RepID=A0A0L6VFE4_9BASI|nr:hypothetical protein VP01_1854g4 [Puccinia sorghi]